MAYDPNEPRNAEGEWTDSGNAIRAAASDKKEFIPAKTLNEAEERIKKAGVMEVDLKGLKPDQFNAVLQAVEEENNISPLKLDKLTTYRSSGSSAKALFSPSNNSLSLNLSKLKVNEYQAIKNYEIQLSDIETSKNFIRENYMGKGNYNQSTVYSRINALNNRAYDIKRKIANGETARYWTVASGFEDKAESLKATMHHELGHYRQYKQLINEHYEGHQKNSISEYGRTSKTEYFAEWYSHYRMNGEKEIPNDILEVFKKLK